MTQKRLPKILDREMRVRGLSGPKAAALFECTHGCLYLWLEGKHVPPRQKARRLAEILRRPGLVKIIDQDRVAHLRERKSARAGAA